MPPQDAYLESQVLNAEPMELVRMLYRAACAATRSASAHLAAGRIAERSRQISKAHAILSQLSVSLDHTRGGTLSRRLLELYDYMQRRLLEANLGQKAEPLAEVERLLTKLLAGWDRIGAVPEPCASPGATRLPERGAPSTESHGYPAVFAPGATAEHSAQSWSL
jgi:flagellar protein FliS